MELKDKQLKIEDALNATKVNTQHFVLFFYRMDEYKYIYMSV